MSFRFAFIHQSLPAMNFDKIPFHNYMKSSHFLFQTSNMWQRSLQSLLVMRVVVTVERIRDWKQSSGFYQELPQGINENRCRDRVCVSAKEA